MSDATQQRLDNLAKAFKELRDLAWNCHLEFDLPNCMVCGYAFRIQYSGERCIDCGEAVCPVCLKDDVGSTVLCLFDGDWCCKACFEELKK